MSACFLRLRLLYTKVRAPNVHTAKDVSGLQTSIEHIRREANAGQEEKKRRLGLEKHVG